ncbi:unnamed protein product, partial [Coregonus sp. 'balchen']
FQQQIPKLAVTKEDTALYVADQLGYALGSENPPPERLQIVDNDQVLLTSSIDCTVRLWSTCRVFIGRGQFTQHTNKPPNHGGPKTYHTLKYFDIIDAPTTCERPNLSLAGIDPFISSFVEQESAKCQ